MYIVIANTDEEYCLLDTAQGEVQNISEDNLINLIKCGVRIENFDRLGYTQGDVDDLPDMEDIEEGIDKYFLLTKNVKFGKASYTLASTDTYSEKAVSLKQLKKLMDEGKVINAKIEVIDGTTVVSLIKGELTVRTSDECIELHKETEKKVESKDKGHWFKEDDGVIKTEDVVKKQPKAMSYEAYMRSLAGDATESIYEDSNMDLDEPASDDSNIKVTYEGEVKKEELTESEDEDIRDTTNTNEDIDNNKNNDIIEDIDLSDLEDLEIDLYEEPVEGENEGDTNGQVESLGEDQEEYNKIGVETSADEAGVEATVVEETVVEETVVEETVVEDTVVEETVAEETVAEETVAEETVAEETVAKETSVEETSVEETSVEETSAEETSAEETSVEETSVEETSVEETVAEETSVEETSVEETVTEEHSVEESFVEETVTEEAVTEETAVEEAVVEEAVAEETVVETSNAEIFNEEASSAEVYESEEVAKDIADNSDVNSKAVSSESISEVTNGDLTEFREENNAASEDAADCSNSDNIVDEYSEEHVYEETLDTVSKDTNSSEEVVNSNECVTEAEEISEEIENMNVVKQDNTVISEADVEQIEYEEQGTSSDNIDTGLSDLISDINLDDIQTVAEPGFSETNDKDTIDSKSEFKPVLADFVNGNVIKPENVKEKQTVKVDLALKGKVRKYLMDLRKKDLDDILSSIEDTGLTSSEMAIIHNMSDGRFSNKIKQSVLLAGLCDGLNTTLELCGMDNTN